MSQRIEDYALVGDTHTAALIGRDGSVDWLCLPRFDSPSCFARLLGTEDHGRWLLAPAGGGTAASRRYRGASTILETEFATDEGRVRVIDFMPPRHVHPRLVRIVEGLEGDVTMTTELVIRCSYGDAIPWVVQSGRSLSAVAGPDGLCLDTPVTLQGRDHRSVGTFRVARGEQVTFCLGWHASHEHPPSPIDPAAALEATAAFWEQWCDRVRRVHGPWEDAVLRSLITLKALTYAPTGGIVAAATTSLPEDLGGVRNWDYRYCWVRDASLTLDALVEAGCREEAERWMAWLVRAAAGAPDQLQIMYGPAGERRLTEFEVDHLPGYEGSKPVRVGNAASEQFQLDVYGELMDATDRARRHGIAEPPEAWALQRAVMDFVSAHWRDPDDGIWEVRGPRRHFTHSKVMAWVAFDRAVRAVERYGKDGPVDEWRRARDEVHAEVLEHGWSEKRGAFTQYYGGDALDASILMLPIVGFLPPDDRRVVSTVEAVERELLADGFVRRYQNDSGVDGLPGQEGAFLPCSFWLADCLALIGRLDDARALFDRLVGLANDLGLLSEEYDHRFGRLVGNFPQAFSHVGLVNTARNLAARDSFA
ncbi:MAG TPA: glycoside hydrolase family 15 protein [Acidimicrobiales bacterium]|nr:glycoside hydrolase family 15 protein [Acidimicrobiales bacterium]